MSENERSFSNLLLDSYYDLCNEASSCSDSCDDSSSDYCSDSCSNSCSNSCSDCCDDSCTDSYNNYSNNSCSSSSTYTCNGSNNNSYKHCNHNTCNQCNRRNRNHHHSSAHSSYNNNYGCNSCSNNYSCNSCNNNYKCSSYTKINNSCSETNYDIETRVQFTVIQPAENICDLLKAIGNEGIEIDGFLLQAINCSCTLFSFVIGLEDCQSSVNLAIVRCLFNKLCICYLENEILRVTFPTTGPGTLASFYCALTSNDIDVSTAYFSADGNALYIDPSCIEGLKDLL